MKIAVSGASGFIGTHLCSYLTQRGHEIVPLSRAELASSSEDGRLRTLIAPCDAVINLAGAPINRRWSKKYKQKLISSRIDTTRRLVEAINCSDRVRTFISTSAVGYYPSVGCYDEMTDGRGDDFLARLCAQWEAEAAKVRTRCVITRFGVVLSPHGGAFPLLTLPARLVRVAVVAGSGCQPFSWIALPDLMRAQEFLLVRDDLSGVFNLTAPEQLTMRQFTTAVARHYKAWLTVHVPAFMVRMALGEAANFALEGQCAVPRRLLESGFQFEIPDLADFLVKL